MPRKDLPPDLTDEALRRLIPEVRSLGSQGTACTRGKERKPKVRYTSAACARRGLVAYSWQVGDVLSPQAVVYHCPWCDWYHAGLSRDVPVRIDVAFGLLSA
jgi:hypothetical protein